MSPVSSSWSDSRSKASSNVKSLLSDSRLVRVYASGFVQQQGQQALIRLIGAPFAIGARKTPLVASGFVFGGEADAAAARRGRPHLP